MSYDGWHWGIEACLNAAGLTISDIDLVSMDKLGKQTHTLYHRDAESVPAAVWQPEEETFLASLGNTPALVVNHHVAHAATSFCMHDMPHAACLIVDGSGSAHPFDQSPHRFVDMGALNVQGDYPLKFNQVRGETQSVFEAHRFAMGNVNIFRKAVSTRSGGGDFYTFFTRHVLGFDHRQEGKSMGLAAWGDPVLASRLLNMPAEVFGGIDTLMLEHLKIIQYCCFKTVDDSGLTWQPRLRTSCWAKKLLVGYRIIRSMVHGRWELVPFFVGQCPRASRINSTCVLNIAKLSSVRANHQ